MASDADEAQNRLIAENRADIRKLQEEMAAMRTESGKVQEQMKALDGKVTTGFTATQDLLKSAADERLADKAAKADAAKLKAKNEHELALKEQDSRDKGQASRAKARNQVLAIVGSTIAALVAAGGGAWWALDDKPDAEPTERHEPAPAPAPESE